jgi:hypothetical protein
MRNRRAKHNVRIELIIAHPSTVYKYDTLFKREESGRVEMNGIYDEFLFHNVEIKISGLFFCCSSFLF